MKKEITDAFNQLATEYEHSIDQTSPYNTLYERPAMLSLIPTDLRNQHVLDAGCAAGWYSEQYIKRGAQVTAIDVSPNMIEAAKRRLGKQAQVQCSDQPIEELKSKNPKQYEYLLKNPHFMILEAKKRG